MAIRPIKPNIPTIPGLSQAMLIEEGRILLLSGHVPTTADGAMPATLEGQLTQIFENMAATLQAAGATFANIARLSIYVKNLTPDALPMIRQVRDRYIDLNNPPASTLLGNVTFFHPDLLVEIDAIAAIP